MRAPILILAALASLVLFQGSVAVTADPLVALRTRQSVLTSNGPGERRRYTQSFGRWTISCDEDLKQRAKVCQAVQQIADATGGLALVWSIAATEDGQPILLFRAPNAQPAPTNLVVKVVGQRADRVSLGACDAEACVGALLIDPALAMALRRASTAEITLMRNGRLLNVLAPIGDLDLALASLEQNRSLF